MVVDLGISWVILGHSERRQIFGETNQTIGMKVAYALSKGLNVIVCIEIEKSEESEAGTPFKVNETQMESIFDNVSADQWGKIVIAYQAVLAVGKGAVATVEVR